VEVIAWLRRLFARHRVSWDDAVAYIEHPSHTLGRQASPHSPPPQAHP
jgi:transposase